MREHLHFLLNIMWLNTSKDPFVLSLFVFSQIQDLISEIAACVVAGGSVLGFVSKAQPLVASKQFS